MHITHNTLKLAIREGSVQLLNTHLAAAIDLQAQLKQAHWNVRGPGFIAVHELFDKVATLVADAADQIAERCAGIGGTPRGTIQVAVAQSFLVPYPLELADTTKHLFAVAAALAAFGQSAREASRVSAEKGDADTSDMFTQISRVIDKELWFIEAHREAKEEVLF
jgi:starvation-inducible DNA-binding protein